MSGSWGTGWIPGDVLTAAEFAKMAGAFYDNVLGAPAASFDINPLPTWGSHLMLLAFLRGDTAAVNAYVGVRFNNDSGANYSYDGIKASGSTIAAFPEGTNQTEMAWGMMPANTATAGAFGALSADVPNFRSTAGHKPFTSMSTHRETTASGGIFLFDVGGIWASTAAITRITVFPFAGNFVAGSRLTAYVLGP